MSKNVFAIFFLAIMVVMGGVSVVIYIQTHLIVNPSNTKFEVTHGHMVKSFAEQYPFQDGEQVYSNSQSITKLGAIHEYMSAMKHAKAGIDFYTKNANPFYSELCGITSWYDESTRGDIITNGQRVIIRLSNGYLTSPYPYSHPVEAWNSLLDFVTWLRARDIQYLSLISADKGDDSFGTIPQGVPVGYTRMAKEYKAFLDQNEIAYLESKPKLLAKNSDFYYWFYKADHHWNVHAGRLMAEETAKRLNEMHIASDTNAAKKENFTLTRYPKCFVGSYSRMLGSPYKENLEIYYPKSTTSFRIVIPSLGIDSTGSFDSTLIAKHYLPSYSAFLYGDKPLIQIENLLSNNSTRVLVIKQSKAEVYNPYLAFSIRYLDIIDPRHFDGSIRSFIEQTKPDIVITCVDVIWKGDEKFWSLK